MLLLPYMILLSLLDPIALLAMQEDQLTCIEWCDSETEDVTLKNSEWMGEM